MLISEIETLLKIIREKHGDIEVYLPIDHDEGSHLLVQSIDVQNLHFEWNEDKGDYIDRKCAIINYEF